MLENVASLLEGSGAGWDDVVSGVLYLKHADVWNDVQAALTESGLTDLPVPVVEAPLCRPELLCELDAAPLVAGE